MIPRARRPRWLPSRLRVPGHQPLDPQGDSHREEDAMMADTIRTGIVGATVTQGGSGWGANAHVPALHLLPDYELQAVCTAHEDTAQASKAQFDAVYAFHDIDAMAQHPEIDLVVVCVRVPGHKHLVMAGLHANKAVFCEWPLGATLAEAQEMATFAKEHGLKTIVGLQARSDPTLMYARDLIHAGYIGDVLTANLSVISQQVLERAPGASGRATASTAPTRSRLPGATPSMACCMS